MMYVDSAIFTGFSSAGPYTLALPTAAAAPTDTCEHNQPNADNSAARGVHPARQLWRRNFPFSFPPPLSPLLPLSLLSGVWGITRENVGIKVLLGKF